MKRAAILIAILLSAAPALYAQWPAFMPKSVPMKDGKPDMDAPSPRTADGKVDLSGVWETFQPRSAAPAPPPVAAAGTGEAPPGAARSVFFNVGASTPDGVAPYQPWAKALMEKRRADNSKDNPDAHCLPLGVMQMTSHPFPKKIIQTPSEVLLIYEGSGTTVREVFLDGRTLPDKDAQPFYNGYSVGRWDGNDTLVIETTNFVDDGWLDVQGSPLTDQGKLTERIRRPTYGSLVIEVTVDDPKAYTKPFTAVVNNRLLPQTQLIEFVCIDKSAQHYVGAEVKK